MSVGGLTKNEFLDQLLLKHKELGKRQREYKKILLTRLKSRKETINHLALESTIEQLRNERNDLKAQIWTSNGKVHRTDNDRYLKLIQCHVDCQEWLSEDIKSFKTSIRNLEREIGRVDKNIYELNRKTVPDTMYQAHVAKTRKKLRILENQFEVALRRECAFAAENAQLREELMTSLKHRSLFNDQYTKLVQKLNADKKYLCDLIEYAIGVFDNCVVVYEKIDLLSKKESKELEARKIEMQNIMRKLAADADNAEFAETKGKYRELDDLQPKEYRRRDEFRRKHHKKIDLYNRVIEKLLDYTQSRDIEEVIKKFQEQRSLYYSYFNYANELSYHITLLNNSVNRLYDDITILKLENHTTLEGQRDIITELEGTLADKREKNAILQNNREMVDTKLKELLDGFTFIFDSVHADASPLMQLLGDHSSINLFNVRRFLKLLELRVADIVAIVYIQERSDGDPKNHENYIVKAIEKIKEVPTILDDIVLTQQCPECAEGEAFNMDESEGGVRIYTLEEARRRQYEKIIQPEMQYRLHSVSECRLPRSRLLAAKRNT